MLQLDDHDGCGVYLTWRILLCVLQRVWSFVNHLQHLKLKDYTLPFIFNWKMGHPGGPELVFLQQPYCYCWVECLNSAHACQHASIPAWPLSHVCINCLALQALDFAILKIYYASNYINSLFAVTVVKVKMSVAQLFLTLCDPVDCSPPGSSVHGILQARILEWVAIPFSRGSSWPRNRTQVSHIAGRFFIIWATREDLMVERVFFF